jgi:hypothetical protein
MKGECATLFKPPNHTLFDPRPTSLSPVLQRRLQNARAVPVVPVAPAPVFNLNIGKEIADIFRPPAPTAFAASMPPPPPPVSSLATPDLIPFARAPGMDMSLADFCERYGLGENILNKFTEHSYKHARVLRFVTIDELREMGFRLGEIAGL